VVRYLITKMMLPTILTLLLLPGWVLIDTMPPKKRPASSRASLAVMKRPASIRATGRAAASKTAARPDRPPKKKARKSAEAGNVSSVELSDSAGDEDGDSDESEESPLVGVYQASAEITSTAQAEFSSASAFVLPGAALLGTHYTRDGFVDFTALYHIHKKFEHKEGVLVEASFVASSGKATQEVQDLRLGCGSYLLLVRAERGDSELRSREGIIVLTQWSAGPLDDFDEKWIHRSERHQFALKANLRAGKSDAPSTPARKRKAALEDQGSASKAPRTTKAKDGGDLSSALSVFPPLPPPAHSPDEEDLLDDSKLPPALRRLKEKAKEGLEGAEVEHDETPVDQEAVINKLKEKIRQMKTSGGTSGKPRKQDLGASSTARGKSTLMQKFLMEKLQRAKDLHAEKGRKGDRKKSDDSDEVVALRAPEVSEDASSGGQASSCSDVIDAGRSGRHKASSSKRGKKRKKKKKKEVELIVRIKHLERLR
jgi:hypothetical protein